MTRDTLERISLWSTALITCLGGAVAVFMVGGVLPAFVQHSGGAVLARLAMLAFFFSLFVAAHHSVRRALTDCDRACSDEPLTQVGAKAV